MPKTSVMSAGLRRYLYFTAAAGGAAVLIVEILGAKMLAPYVGTSHFVWTAQIAVTLVALATGYAAGGWLADRSPKMRNIYVAFLLAAIWLCGSAIACEPVAFACLRFQLAVGSLLASTALFFVPLALMATVGPLCVRKLTISLDNVGQNVGRLTAISTMGSVAGTVLIGYVLIPFFANSTILYSTAAFLTLLSAGYFLIWNRKQSITALAAAAAVTILIAAGLGEKPFAHLPGLRELFRANSNFGMMQVVEAESGKRRYFLNDLLSQNSYDPIDHSSASLFTYVLEALIHGYIGDPKDTLCIGMGVGVIPMHLSAAGSRVDVVEINPAVIPIAERYFDFHPERVRLAVGDGRYFLYATAKKYDSIVLDAFLGESPPSHLMTKETFQAIQRHLKPGGLLVMNTFGEFEAGKDFMISSIDRTLRQVFQTVRVHGAHGGVYFAASDRGDLPMLQLPDFEGVPADIRRYARVALEESQTPDPSHGMILTDNYNPSAYWDAANRELLRKRLAISYRGD